MNVEIDYAFGRFTVMEITKDGLARVLGGKTFSSRDDAENAAESYLRNVRGHVRLVIVQMHEQLWLDPKPKMLRNRTLPTDAQMAT